LKHLPTIPVLLVAALTIEGLGSLCLITGPAARAAVALVFLYRFPSRSCCTILCQTHFRKISDLWAASLMIALYGPGRFALRPRLTPSTAIELQSSVR
jgi:hypothetical protein